MIDWDAQKILARWLVANGCSPNRYQALTARISEHYRIHIPLAGTANRLATALLDVESKSGIDFGLDQLMRKIEESES